MKLTVSRFVVIAPALALLFIGVASIVFSLGATGGGSRGVPGALPAAGPGAASPAPTGRGLPRVGGGRPATGPGTVIGTVTSKTASAIVVTTLGGQTVTVNVSAATTYSVRGVTAPTIDSVVVGSQIVVQGMLNADGSVDATRIQTGGRGFGGGRSRGGGFGQPTPAPSGLGT
jgi:hypothetical protein